MTKNRNIIRLLVLIGISLIVLFPARILAAINPVQKPLFKFDSYSKEHGLGNLHAFEVVQDGQGFIWVATMEGLYRFDGYEFKIFKHQPDNPNSLPGNYIKGVYIDPDGALWVSIGATGMALYHPQTESFTRYRHDPNNPNSLGSDEISAMVFDKNGVMWLATGDNGLNRFNPVTQTFRHFVYNTNDPNSINDNVVHSLIQDRQGIFWLGTKNGGLNRFDSKTGKFKHYRNNPNDPDSLSYNQILSLAETPDGKIWVGTSKGGLNRFDRDSEKFTRYRPDPNNPGSISHRRVPALFVDSNDTLWVGVKGGLNRYDPQNDRFFGYHWVAQNQSSLPKGNVNGITQDNNGLIWLSLFGGGLTKFDPASELFGMVRHDINDPDSLTKGVVLAIHIDRQGSLWVGTQFGLNRYDRATGRFEHYLHEPSDPTSLGDDSIWSIHEDNKGTLWFGSAKAGLNRFNRETNTFTRFPHDPTDDSSLSHNWTLEITEDGDGSLWVGTNTGLNRYDPQSETFTRFYHNTDDPNSLSDDYIISMYTAADGSLWVGTFEGVNHFNPDKQSFTRYQHDPNNPNSLGNNVVYAINQDQQGIFWFGTRGGLNRFDADTNTFTYYGEKNGFSSSTINDVLPDNKGNLWLGMGDDSLAYFNPQTGELHNHAGAQAGCGSSSGSAFEAPDGQLFFGSTERFCAFYPEQVLQTGEVPTVALTDFLLLNKSVPLNQVINHTSSLTLGHKDNILSFEFAALHYADPKRNQYRYKLEGFNEQWIQTSAKKRHATYTNLSPGSYTFRVKASNNQGVWSQQGRAIELIIQPAPWQTWWAYCLYALLALVLVLAFVRAQRKKVHYERQVNAQLKQVDKLKDDFLSNTSHELRTPLNGIIGLAESLYDGAAGQMSDKATEDLALIVSSSKRLSALVNDILDFSKLRHQQLGIMQKQVDMFAITEVVLKLSQPLVGDKALKLFNQVDPNIAMVVGDEDRLMQVMLNLVGNAIKFTHQGSVSIDAQISQPFLQVSISDTGIGVDADKFESIFASFEQADGTISREFGGTGIGLAISKQLIDSHGGRIWLESEPGQGSQFYFTVPLVAQTEAQQRPESTEQPIQINIPQAVKPQPQSEKPRNEDSVRILAVDDDPVNLRVLENQLTLANFDVVKASDGFAALEQIQSNGPFDLVLLDVMMPRLSGYNVCSQIRQSVSPAHLPIILLTAKNQSKDMVTGFKSGANDYVVKPFSKNELLARISTHLELLKSNRELADYSHTLEDKVELRTQQMTEANQRLVALGQFKEGMMGMIVHDLKTPLQSMLLADANDPLTHPEHTRRSATMMLNLVMDILDVQKFADAKLHLSEVTFNIERIIDQAIAQVAYMANAKSVAIVNQLNNAIHVLADKHLVERVFVNLLNNAVKFSSHNALVTITATPQADNFCQFSVVDKGHGIPKNKLDSVFDQFVQVDPSDKSNYRGSGLGLTFCKLVIEAHGGTITVDSIENVATTFTFTLPLSADQTQVQTDDEPLPPSVKTPSLPLLSAPNHQRLSSSIEQLRQCEIYKVTQLRRILDSIETKDENIRQWEKALGEAIDNGNENRFKALLEPEDS